MAAMESEAVTTGLGVLPEMGPLMLKSGLMLLLVLAILVGFFYLLKRGTGMGNLSQNGALKVRGSYHIGPKERLMLVDVEGVRLLLGVTPQSIQTLHTFEETAPDTEPVEATPSFFEALFRKQLKKEAPRDADS